MTNEIDRERRELALARSQRSAAKAEHLLSHYLREVWEAAGLKWDGDHYAEVGEIVSLIIEAAADASQARG